jgi:hypothetical protein
MLFSRTAARAIPQTFGALHRADKGCLLEQAVTAHSAAKEWTFYPFLYGRQHAGVDGFFFERQVWWLPPASWCKDWHMLRISFLLEPVFGKVFAYWLK